MEKSLKHKNVQAYILIVILTSDDIIKSCRFWEMLEREGEWNSMVSLFESVIYRDIIVALESLESPLEYKEIKLVNPKRNQPWIFIGRTGAEAEAPILWSPDEKSWLIGRDPDAGKDWGQEEKGTTEDEMVGWHPRLSGHEFEQALGDGEGQEAWRAVVHGVTKSWTLLSDWATTSCSFKVVSKWAECVASGIP